jgi:hypothetical protein
MILPEFQNRGIASQAVRAVLEKARVERKFGQIHAFPAVTNGPSNKICEKNGFTNLGECEVEFAGWGLRCNHWRIGLFQIRRRWRMARAFPRFGSLSAGVLVCRGTVTGSRPAPLRWSSACGRRHSSGAAGFGVDEAERGEAGGEGDGGDQRLEAAARKVILTGNVAPPYSAAGLAGWRCRG